LLKASYTAKRIRGTFNVLVCNQPKAISKQAQPQLRAEPIDRPSRPAQLSLDMATKLNPSAAEFVPGSFAESMVSNWGSTEDCSEVSCMLSIVFGKQDVWCCAWSKRIPSAVFSIKRALGLRLALSELPLRPVLALSIRWEELAATSASLSHDFHRLSSFCVEITGSHHA